MVVVQYFDEIHKFKASFNHLKKSKMISMFFRVVFTQHINFSVTPNVYLEPILNAKNRELKLSAIPWLLAQH